MVANSSKIQVEGEKQLRAKLRALGDTQVPNALKKVHKEVAEIVAADARARTPVRTGRLRASIRTGAQLSGATVSEGGAKVPYAPWIDFGGNRPHVRPFLPQGRILFPALEARRPEAEAKYLSAIEQVLRGF